MKYKEAQKIGEASCCYTPREIYNNINNHACNFFAYDDIEKEMEELIYDMERLGFITINKKDDSK